MHRHPARRRPIRLLALLAAASATAAAAAAAPLLATPGSGVGAVIVDVRDGGVLYETGADQPQSPGAASRLMVLYLTAEAVEAGRLRLNETLPGPAGPRSVADALQALGGSDPGRAASQLARRLAGDEARFALEMTRRARALGMTRTRFVNVSGARQPGQTSTAADVATLMWSLRRDYPAAGAWLGPGKGPSRLLRTVAPPACLVPRVARIRCAPGRDDPHGAVAIVMGRPRGLPDLLRLADAGRAMADRVVGGQGVVVAQTLAGAPPPERSGEDMVILVTPPPDGFTL